MIEEAGKGQARLDLSEKGAAFSSGSITRREERPVGGESVVSRATRTSQIVAVTPVGRVGRNAQMAFIALGSTVVLPGLGALAAMGAFDCRRSGGGGGVGLAGLRVAR